MPREFHVYLRKPAEDAVGPRRAESISTQKIFIGP
jgi:hypothetical protein